VALKYRSETKVVFNKQSLKHMVSRASRGLIERQIAKVFSPSRVVGGSVKIRLLVLLA
jgi:hypothetical protein